MGGAEARAAPWLPSVRSASLYGPRGLDPGWAVSSALTSEASLWLQPSAARALTKAGSQDSRKEGTSFPGPGPGMHTLCSGLLSWAPLASLSLLTGGRDGREGDQEDGEPGGSCRQDAVASIFVTFSG